MGSWVIYWDRNAIKIQGPPAGSYSGMGMYWFFYDNAGYLMKVAPGAGGAASLTLGPWKKPSATFVPGDVVQVMCEFVEGDVESGRSSAFGTWIQLQPNIYGTDYPGWAAENSTSVRKAILKFTLKDQNNNQIVWWARVVDGGIGEVSYTLIPLDPPTSGGGGGGGGGGIGGRPPDRA